MHFFPFTDCVRHRFSQDDVAVPDQIIKTRMDRFLKGADDWRGGRNLRRPRSSGKYYNLIWIWSRNCHFFYKQTQTPTIAIATIAPIAPIATVATVAALVAFLIDSFVCFFYVVFVVGCFLFHLFFKKVAFVYKSNC